MEQVLVFILGLIVGGGAVWFLKNKPAREPKADADLIARQAEKYEKNKQKVLDFLQGREKVSNNDIEKLLGVSDATAERYLSELEEEGRVRQVGKTGQSVFYQKI